MDLMKLATDLIMKQFGGSVSEGNATSALSGLFGDGKGGLDIASLVSKLAGSGSMGDLVKSWLGDGENKGISVSQITEIFGDNKLSDFAQNLGVEKESATKGLADMLPNLIDKSSSGGSLLDSVGGLGGMMDAAKKLF